MKISRSIFKHVLAITILTFVMVGVGTTGYILWQMRQHRDMVAAAHQEREDMADRIWKAKTENARKYKDVNTTEEGGEG